MSNLPDTKDFIGYKSSYTSSIPQQSGRKYDLEEIHLRFKRGRDQVGDKVLIQKGNELINYDFYISTPLPVGAKDLFGYSIKDDSLTIHLIDEEDNVQTVVVRESRGVKWRTFGSKKFMPFEIKDDFIFLFSGMGEIVIMKMLGLSYIMVQADGMVKHLPKEIKDQAANRTVIVLQDNDESFRNIVPKIQEFFSQSEVLIMDFERILDRELDHGYDFRDFCNEIKDAPKVMNLIEEEIIKQQEVHYARVG